MIDRHDIAAVLADPQRTQAVVVAAFRAREVLVNVDGQGRTVDGDDALMVARNQLDGAIVLDPALAGLADRLDA